MALIDITTFRLAPGTTEEAFLEADERVRTSVLYQRPELVRATTARGDDGEWTVIVLWDAAAAPVALGDTELRPLVDGVERRQYHTLD